MSASPLRVVGLVGSLRSGSFTRAVVELALVGAAELGAETTLMDLNEFRLSFCGLTPEHPEEVQRLRDLTRAAHGIILGSPEYHGSYSGVLKNALDLMSFEEFEGKMLGLVGVGGGALGAAGAL
ncbi:MAG: NAD(P)H-dependent oxidoreductase, partial [Armatimonadetes bacterium]|nr:NAD(P)H-dependent oxidoreductase [Armatimonadota bacterium]